mgnify:CR=1 FL=1
MYSFNDPNEFPKEQLLFTYEEFKQFLSVETDIKWIGIFEILYYCELRRGELRGLQWKDINFKDRILSISKQINDRCGTAKNWRFSVPKTKSSIRKSSQTTLKRWKTWQKRYLYSMIISLPQEICFLYVAIHLLIIKMLTAN